MSCPRIRLLSCTWSLLHFWLNIRCFIQAPKSTENTDSVPARLLLIVIREGPIPKSWWKNYQGTEVEVGFGTKKTTDRFTCSPARSDASDSSCDLLSGFSPSSVEPCAFSATPLPAEISSGTPFYFFNRSSNLHFSDFMASDSRKASGVKPPGPEGGFANMPFKAWLKAPPMASFPNSKTTPSKGGRPPAQVWSMLSFGGKLRSHSKGDSKMETALCTSFSCSGFAEWAWYWLSRYLFNFLLNSQKFTGPAFPDTSPLLKGSASFVRAMVAKMPDITVSNSGTDEARWTMIKSLEHCSKKLLRPNMLSDIWMICLASEDFLSIAPMDINWFTVLAEGTRFGVAHSIWSFRYWATLVLFGLTIFPSADGVAAMIRLTSWISCSRRSPVNPKNSPCFWWNSEAFALATVSSVSLAKNLKSNGSS